MKDNIVPIKTKGRDQTTKRFTRGETRDKTPKFLIIKGRIKT
jgi:hypothetical protein